MSVARRAVIDVGTNSVKLLVADVSRREVEPVIEQSRQTRLGQGFYEAHRLQEAAISRTAAAVARFAADARAAGAESIRVLATSAARDASNTGDLASAIQASCGLATEVISGEQEAELAFQGVTTDPDLAVEPLLLLEVGGGSSQFILGQGEHKHFSASCHMGTVRLLERIPHSDPPKAGELDACRDWIDQFLAAEIRPRLEPAMAGEMQMHPSARRIGLVGTGGTASILARIESELRDFNRAAIDSTRLSHERLRWQADRLWSVSLAERQKVVGLPPNRADVILPGVMVYERVMAQFGFPELRVSTRGLRFAALMTPG